MSVAEREVRAGAVSLPLPAGWEDRTVLTIAGPPVHGVSPNVVVTREELCANMGLGGFAGGWVSRLADELPLHERRPLEHGHVAGHRAQVRCLEWTVQGTTFVQLVALLTAGGHGYAVVCTAPAQAFDELEPGFRAVLEGLRLDAAERV